jgi:hypothetical protein
MDFTGEDGASEDDGRIIAASHFKQIFSVIFWVLFGVHFGGCF